MRTRPPCHHVPVILGPSSAPSRRTRFLAGGAVLALAAAVLSGCNSDDDPKAEPTTPQPTPSVTVPEGIELTEAGAKLEFGESADVAYEPNPQRSSVLELTVDKVQQGSIADLGSYVLDEKTRASTPYYVSVTVKNVGTGDVGRTPIPLWAVDANDTLIQASTFTNAFATCPSKPLPQSFAPAAETSTCLVYLIPDKGTLTGVSYRPVQAYAPILWTGTVEPPKSITKKKAS